MEAAIATADLRCRYGRTEAVHGLTLTVEPGTVFALLGPNGAGKTSTIRMLMNIQRPSGGHATVLGVDSRHLGAGELATIGYVSENQKLPAWMTVDQLLAYCRPLYPTWDESLCRKLLADFDLDGGAKIASLSRGMRVKAALVSSLAYRPRLLVLDEPFSGLDPVVRDDLIHGVLELAGQEQWTVFLSSHDLDEVERLVDTVGFIDAGTLVLAEPFERLHARFRRVEITLASEDGAGRDQPAGAWTRVQQAGRVVRFVDTQYVEGETSPGRGMVCVDRDRRATDDAPRDLRRDCARPAGGAAMNQTLHIIRKDVRRLRWPLVAWVTILACGVLLMTAGSSVRGDDAVQSMVATIWGLTVFVEVLMLGLLVSWIVHDEPLVGRDAFWLTRPIRPNDLLVAKLLLTAGVLVILPLLGHTAALRWLGADARELALAAPSYVVTQALAVLLLLAVAVLTPSLTRFVFAIAGCITAFVVIEVIIGVVSQFRARNQIAVYAGPYAPPDLTSSVVLPLLAIGVALAVVVYQYRRRWMSRAIVIAVAGALAAVEVSDVWPWRFAREIEPGPGSWADDAARTAAVLDTTSPFDVSDGWSRRPSSTPQKRVAARVDLAGAPPEYAFTVGGIRTRLVFPDGASLQSAQNDNVAVHRPPRDSTAPLRALLGRARLATIAAGDSDTVPVILAVTKTDYERYGRQAGSLTATVDFHLSRFREIGALPLADGAMLRDQMDRFEVLRVVRRSDGCDVTIRQFNLNALWAARAHRHLYFVLRNAGRGQATDGDQEWMPLGTMNGFGLFGVTVDANSAGLSVSSLVVHFPGTRPKAGDQPRMDQTWLDGADLLVIESVPAGWITRTLTVDGFRMQP